MPRLTVTLSDEHERILERQSDVGEAYRSKSEVVRECIEAYERVDDLSNQLRTLEAEVNMLREQREQLQAKAARVDELETQLRQLQLAYHTAIEEGRSPTELEPMIEEAEENPPTAESTVAAENTQTTSTTTVEATSTEHIEHVEATEPESREPVAANAHGSTGPANTGRAGEASTEKAGTGSVEIDEELLYQSPGVGTRLKSALFGGPGGSR